MVKEVTNYNELKREVQIAEANGKHVVVDFFATWCGACKAMGPRFVALEKRYPTIVFIKADVDKAKDLAHMAGVHAMPTFQVLVRGTRVGEVVGVDEKGLIAMLDKYQ